MADFPEPIVWQEKFYFDATKASDVPWYLLGRHPRWVIFAMDMTKL